jgi:hypothetical protein
MLLSQPTFPNIKQTDKIPSTESVAHTLFEKSLLKIVANPF